MSETLKFLETDLSEINPEKDQIRIHLAEKKEGTARQLNPLSKVGFWLAMIVLSYIFVVTFALLYNYFTNIPETPQLVLGDSTSTNSILIDGYERLSDISTDRSLKLFDQLIHKTILPVLTAILGYIFGIRGIEKQEDDYE